MPDTEIPPDVDGMNDDRSYWAKKAIEAFQEATRAENETVIGDLICDLAHLCDRQPEMGSMAHHIRNAIGNYLEETRMTGEGFEDLPDLLSIREE